MATNCTIAPFINQGFYLTGTWGEQRATHKHAGVDLSTGGKANVYNMFKGTCIVVDHTGTTGSGYGPYIIIQEDNGRTWLYGDLEKFSNYKVGDVIEQFALISTEGNPSGTSSTGLHVHVELEMLGKGQAFKYGYIIHQILVLLWVFQIVKMAYNIYLMAKFLNLNLNLSLK